MFEPKIYAVSGEDRLLSGNALVELVCAVLERDKPFRFRAGGSSMAPFIRDGDFITITSPDRHNLRAGDVLSFRHPGNGRLVIHRLVRKLDGRYLMKGDSSASVAVTIQPENILGKVDMVERNEIPVIFGFGPERFLIAFLSFEKIDRCLSRRLRHIRRFVNYLLRRMAT